MWNDKKHNLTKPKRKKDDTPLHSSVQAIFAYYDKTGKSPQATMTKADLPLVLPRTVTPRELINVLKKDFPELYIEFGPTEAQICHHYKQLKGSGDSSETLVDSATKYSKAFAVKTSTQGLLGFGFRDQSLDNQESPKVERNLFGLADKKDRDKLDLSAVEDEEDEDEDKEEIEVYSDDKSKDKDSESGQSESPDE